MVWAGAWECERGGGRQVAHAAGHGAAGAAAGDGGGGPSREGGPHRSRQQRRAEAALRGAHAGVRSALHRIAAAGAPCPAPPRPVLAPRLAAAQIAAPGGWPGAKYPGQVALKGAAGGEGRGGGRAGGAPGRRRAAAIPRAAPRPALQPHRLPGRPAGRLLPPYFFSCLSIMCSTQPASSGARAAPPSWHHPGRAAGMHAGSPIRGAHAGALRQPVQLPGVLQALPGVPQLHLVVREEAAGGPAVAGAPPAPPPGTCAVGSFADETCHQVPPTPACGCASSLPLPPVRRRVASHRSLWPRRRRGRRRRRSGGCSGRRRPPPTRCATHLQLPRPLAFSCRTPHRVAAPPLTQQHRGRPTRHCERRGAAGLQ